MSQQTEYFKQAELALAAYAKNLATGNPDPVKLIEDAEFSDVQADKFSATYRVVTQYTDVTGLSATEFADSDKNTFLAIRGTEKTDIRDFATGVFDIMLFGSTQLHLQYNSFKTKITEWLGNGTLSPTFTVTGHGMGGFLATGLVNDPDFASNVSHAYLYNTPGLGGFLGPSINTVLGWIGFAEAYDQSKISNIEAATGISPISGLGFDAAPPIEILSLKIKWLLI